PLLQAERERLGEILYRVDALLYLLDVARVLARPGALLEVRGRLLPVRRAERARGNPVRRARHAAGAEAGASAVGGGRLRGRGGAIEVGQAGVQLVRGRAHGVVIGRFARALDVVAAGALLRVERPPPAVRQTRRGELSRWRRQRRLAGRQFA